MKKLNTWLKREMTFKYNLIAKEITMMREIRGHTSPKSLLFPNSKNMFQNGATLEDEWFCFT